MRKHHNNQVMNEISKENSGLLKGEYLYLQDALDQSHQRNVVIHNNCHKI